MFTMFIFEIVWVTKEKEQFLAKIIMTIHDY